MTTRAVPEWSERAWSRRLWLQSTCGLGASTAVFCSPLAILAQDTRLLDAARAMSVMTGAELQEPWIEPTTALVGIILDYSKALRALDLGELEPATIFVAR